MSSDQQDFQAFDEEEAPNKRSFFFTDLALQSRKDPPSDPNAQTLVLNSDSEPPVRDPNSTVIESPELWAKSQENFKAPPTQIGEGFDEDVSEYAADVGFDFEEDEEEDALHPPRPKRRPKPQSEAQPTLVDAAPVPTTPQQPTQMLDTGPGEPSADSNDDITLTDVNSGNMPTLVLPAMDTPERAPAASEPKDELEAEENLAKTQILSSDELEDLATNFDLPSDDDFGAVNPLPEVDERASATAGTNDSRLTSEDELTDIMSAFASEGDNGEDGWDLADHDVLQGDLLSPAASADIADVLPDDSEPDVLPPDEELSGIEDAGWGDEAFALPDDSDDGFGTGALPALTPAAAKPAPDSATPNALESAPQPAAPADSLIPTPEASPAAGHDLIPDGAELVANPYPDAPAVDSSSREGEIDSLLNSGDSFDDLFEHSDMEEPPHSEEAELELESAHAFEDEGPSTAVLARPPEDDPANEIAPAANAAEPNPLMAAAFADDNDVEPEPPARRAAQSAEPEADEYPELDGDQLEAPNLPDTPPTDGTEAPEQTLDADEEGLADLLVNENTAEEPDGTVPAVKAADALPQESAQIDVSDLMGDEVDDLSLTNIIESSAIGEGLAELDSDEPESEEAELAEDQGLGDLIGDGLSDADDSSGDESWGNPPEEAAMDLSDAERDVSELMSNGEQDLKEDDPWGGVVDGSAQAEEAAAWGGEAETNMDALLSAMDVSENVSGSADDIIADPGWLERHLPKDHPAYKTVAALRDGILSRAEAIDNLIGWRANWRLYLTMTSIAIITICTAIWIGAGLDSSGGTK